MSRKQYFLISIPAIAMIIAPMVTLGVLLTEKRVITSGYYIHDNYVESKTYYRSNGTKKQIEHYNNGVLQRRLLIHPNDSIAYRPIVKEFEYEYDSNGRIKRKTTYTGNRRRSKIEITIDEFDYDSQGNLINMRRVQN